MQTIGINLGHNSSAVLISDGEQVLRLEEEKIAQVKGFYGFPRQSIDYIIQHVDASKNVQVVIGHKAIYEIFQSHRLIVKFCGLASRFEFIFYFFDLMKFIFPSFKVLRFSTKIHLEYNLKKKSEIFNSIKYCDHHEAQEFSATYDSGYKECTVITLDGKGDSFSGKTFDYSEGELSLIKSNPDIGSYGLVYSAATKALGFKMLRHEGKITGLAAYGDPSKIESLIHVRFEYLKKNIPTKNTKLKKSNFREKISERFLDPDLKLYGRLIDSWVLFFSEFKGMGISNEDVAAGVQSFLEKSVLNEIESLRKNNQLRDQIALAGGVFANVKLNQRIWETGYFSGLFVQPAMDDAGTALGAAASVLEGMNENQRLGQVVYLGRLKEDSGLKDEQRHFQIMNVTSGNVSLTCAKLIGEGKIVGVYNGRTEWGPRALGNRSIIASAFLPHVPSLLNQRLKRNDFMPFAPIIRDIDAERVFENYSKDLVAAKFMTVTLDVNSEFKRLIPSVVHLDGTARPQVLCREDNPAMYAILDGIAQESGIGIALNTSFNMHELPILDTLEVALHNLSIGAIDFLMVDNREILKRQES